MEQSILRFKVGTRAVEVFVESGPQALAVLGVNPVQPLSWAAGQFVLIKADQGIPARRVVNAIRPQVPVPQPVLRGLDG